MDRELLERYSEGLIVLSGCPSGELLQRLREDDQQGAREVAGWYSDVFKGRYYLEVMEHGIDQFSQLTPKVADLARSLDLPLVHTHDSHYTSPNMLSRTISCSALVRTRPLARRIASDSVAISST